MVMYNKADGCDSLEGSGVHRVLRVRARAESRSPTPADRPRKRLSTNRVAELAPEGPTRWAELTSAAATPHNVDIQQGAPVVRLRPHPREEDNRHLIHVPVGIYERGAAAEGVLTGYRIAQIDPGASISLVSRSVVTELRLASQRDVVKAYAAFGKGADGSDAPSLVEFQDMVPMCVVMTGHDGERRVRVPISIRAHVVDHNDFDILIGASDLAQYMVKIDMFTQRLEFSQKWARRSAPNTIQVLGASREILYTHRGREVGRRVMAVQLAESLRSPVEREQQAERERQELAAYDARCSKTDDSRRPELFPLEYWHCLPDEKRDDVMGRYQLFTAERLQVIIPKIASIDVSMEDAQRKAEEPYVRALFYAYPDALFVKNELDIQPIKDEIFHLEVTDTVTPIVNKSKVRGFTAEERAFLSAKTRKMMRQNRLIKRAGPHESGVVLVPYDERIQAFKAKHGDEAASKMVDPDYDDEVSQWFRLTVNFKELNARLKQHKFPLPRIRDLLDKGGQKRSSRWSAADVEDAFFTIKIDPQSQEYTGFSTHNEHFMFTCMPQGVATAAEVWAEVVNKTFAELLIFDMFFYQDDIFVYSGGLQEHLSVWEMVFQRMVAKGMTCKPSKFHANYRMMKCLGHILTEDGRYPDPELVRSITDLGIPQDQSAVRSLVALGVTAQEYVHSLADIIAPLQDLLKKDVDVQTAWKPEVHGKSLEQLKRVLTEAPVLMAVDTTKRFRLHVDACKQGRGLGAVLLQEDEHGRWRPVAYWSYKLTDTERGYSATDLECKAMHDAILKWSNYLRNGMGFEVITDHYALVYMATRSPRANNGRVMNYTANLMGYRFSVRHRKGSDHLDADAVSRLFRHEDRSTRILTEDDLVERGVVTKKDELDLAARGITLPRAGIDVPTIEERLEQERFREGSADPMSRQQTRELIDRITLRHELEQLEGVEDDPWCFNEYVRRLRADTEVVSASCEGAQGPPVECSANAVVNTLSVAEFVRNGEGDVIRDTDGPPVKRVRFSAVVEWRKYYYDEDTPLSIGTKAGEQYTVKFAPSGPSLLNDDSVGGMGLFDDDKGVQHVRTLKVKRRQQKRKSALQAPRKEQARNMAALLLMHKRSLRLSETDVAFGERATSSHWTLLQEMLRLGIHDGDIERLLEHFPEDLRVLLRKRLEQEVVGNKQGEKTAHEQLVQEEVERYAHLLGELFVDNDNGRLYRVASISWNEAAQCVVAQRVVQDGLPPDILDGDTFVVDGNTDDSITALVEKYRLRNPDKIGVQWLDERAFALLQLQEPQWKSVVSQAVAEGIVAADGYLEWRPTDDKEMLYRWHPSKEYALRVLLQRSHTHGGITMLQNLCCVVVPDVAVTALLDRYHERFGHPGHDRMYRTIMLRYYWPGMQKDIGVHANSCIHCQRRKHLHSKRTPLLSFPKNTEPFERCHMDLCGPFVVTGRGMQYILVFKDALTKWVELFALPDKSELSVAECLFDEILMRHGAPRVLISDQGTEFVNKVIDQIAILLRIRRVTTSPYHPRADGLAENQVSTLKDMLSAYVNVFQTDWDDYLAIVAHYYRTTVSSATGYTPYFMMYGRECRKPDEQWIQAVGQLSDDEEIFVTDYVRGLSESMRLIWEMIGAELEDKATARNERVNKGIKQIASFEVGDRVWLEQPPVTSFISQDDNERFKVKKAFRPRFSGTYEVVKKVSPITYVLNIGGQYKHHSVDRMKAFKERPERLVRAPAQREEVEEAKEEVDKVEIVASRKGQRRFFGGDKEMVVEVEEPSELGYPNTRSHGASAKRIRGVWLRRLVSDVQVGWDRQVNSEDSYTDSLSYSYIKSYLF